MDAHSNYIMRLSDNRVGELRREASEHAMSQAARRRRGSLWAVTPQALPVPLDEEIRLRRSA